MDHPHPLRLEVAPTLASLLVQEDTDQDRAITIYDRGPKSFVLQSVDGREQTVEGTYALANLLQELALAKGDYLQLDPSSLSGPAPARLSQAIRERHWDELTRCIDLDHLAQVTGDPKGDGTPRLYLPKSDRTAWSYYRPCAGEIAILPLTCPVAPATVQALNRAPGLLGMAFDAQGRPLPYCVPGGRFHEMYGWDSYFIALGLVADGKAELAKAMTDHMVYQIRHYGAILNANRTYYLTRSQPPFLTSMLRLLVEHFPDSAWIAQTLRAAALEYEQVWRSPERLQACGLSRYFCQGVGYPPETLLRHYGQIMEPYAKEHQMSVEEFRQAYLRREIAPVELDAYFREDRAVRESGHDTSYRLEGRCTRLATVDLNSLLYRYEVDIADILQRWFPTGLDGVPSCGVWRDRAQRRQTIMNQLCWTSRGYFDYDFERGMATDFVSATNLYPLWAGLATPQQADLMVEQTLALLEEPGGVAGSTLDSRGAVGPRRTPRQWDYPYGWAPHQMLIWQGLRDYGYDDLASRLAFRWMTMLTRCAIDFNGVLAEKYDLKRCSHEVFAEYDNQGAEVRYVPREGFGWTNASYQVGLTLLRAEQRERLDQMVASDSSGLSQS